jgi:flagellar biosynthesis protein FlhG
MEGISKIEDFEKMPFTVTICSGKGGVGKSIILSNLAELLSKNKNILVWDADSYFPNQHFIFGVEPHLRLNLVYSNQIKITQAIYKIHENLYLLADLPAIGQYSKNMPVLIIDLFKDLIMDTNFDLILFDTPAGISENLIQCIKISDLILLTITDEPTSILDAYGLLKIILKYQKKEKIRLLINNVIDDEDANELYRKFNAVTSKFLNFNINLFDYIPYDREFRISLNKQELLVNYHNNLDLINNLERMTIKLLNEME